jgi:folate-binding protein YgfZ
MPAAELAASREHETMNDWNDFLRQSGLTNDGADFGNAAAELAAAREAGVVVPLDDLALIRASGADAAGFLHNLLSNDVKHLAADEARFAGFCTAKGRLLATLLIWRDGPDYLVALSRDIHAGILKKLSMYILRSKVKLTDASAERVLIGAAGRNAAKAIAALGTAPDQAMKTKTVPGGSVVALDSGRFVLAVEPAAAQPAWKQLAAHLRPAGLSAWHWLEVAAGMPRVVAATQEAFVPQMVNLEVVGGVSFTKGCYPGQEIVARAQYLGKVKRRMYRARLEVPAKAGDHLFSAAAADAASCGELVEVAPSPEGGYECLAVVQSPCVDAGDVRLGTLDGPRLSILALPYAVP